MSSKSRQKPQPRKKPSGDAGGKGAAGAAPARKPEHEELIHAPTRTSKLRFVLTLVVVIILLVIFIIPSALMGACRRNPLAETRLTWEHPSRGHVELTVAEFGNERVLWTTLFEFLSRDRSLDLTDEQVAWLIVVDGLAEASGVASTDNELVETVRGFITAGFGGDARAYQEYIRGQRISVREFEETLRRYLRQQRYLSWFGFMGQQPSTRAVDALWHASHRDYRFQVAELDLGTLYAEVAADAPATDEELAAWVDGLGAAARAPFTIPERDRLEQVRLVFGDDFDGTALLAAWPAPEGTDPEEQARSYHGLMSASRFMNPFPENPTPESFRNWVQTKPFEEVAEQARAEAPLYFAFEAFHDSLLERLEAGEEVDLAAEAAALGLAYDAGELHTWDEWKELETWGGVQLVGRVRSLEPGTLAPQVITEKDALVIARITEKVPAERKPMDEIRDEVVEAWIEDNLDEAGQQKLGELYDRFVPRLEDGTVTGEPSVDAAGFEAAAQEMGFEVVTTDWVDSGARFKMPVPGAELTLEELIGRRSELFELGADQLSQPFFDAENEHAYLACNAGEREADLSGLTPLEFDRLYGQAASDSMQFLRHSALGALPPANPGQRQIVPDVDVEALGARYGLRLIEPKKSKEE